MQASTRMPAGYQPPLGLPFSWRDEQSGELARAVMAYLEHCTDNRTVTDAQIVLVRDYLQYYVSAPCWDHTGGFQSELKHLRSTIRDCQTATEIHDWIHQALDIGMDPL